MRGEWSREKPLDLKTAKILTIPVNGVVVEVITMVLAIEEGYPEAQCKENNNRLMGTG